MKTANIAAAKTHFSRLIDHVRRGESVLITDRSRPVARIEPVQAVPEQLAALCANGLLTLPRRKLDVPAFLAAPRPRLTVTASLSAAVLAEREDGR